MWVWISRAGCRNFTWSVTSCLSYLTLFLEMCERSALGWLGFLCGFDLPRVKECELKISQGLWHRSNVSTQTAQFPIANILRVLVSVSCPLLNQSKEVTQKSGNGHGKKIMFCRCVVSESDLSSTARHNPAASLSTAKCQKGFCACSLWHMFSSQCFYSCKNTVLIEKYLLMCQNSMHQENYIFFFIMYILQNFSSFLQCSKRTNLLQNISGFLLSHLF